MVKFCKELISFIFLGLATSVCSSNVTTESNQSVSGQNSSSVSEKPRMFSMPLTNYYNSEYSGQVQIGTTSQSLNLVFDTGALWVLVNNSTDQTYSASKCNSSSMCNLLGYGNVKKTQFDYLTFGETIGGYIIADNVDLNNSTNKINQTILLSDTPSPKWSKYSDGICGLSLKNGNQPTLLDNMMSTNVISQKTFGLYLSNNPEAFGETTSEIVFGGYNSNYFTGNFTNVSLVPNSPYWQTNFGGLLLVNNNQTAQVQLAAETAIIASGLNNILFSNDDFFALINSLSTNYQLNCSFPPSQTLLNCDCPDGNISSFPNISFILGSQPMTIPPSLYLDITEVGCNLLIQGTLENEQSSFSPNPSNNTGTNSSSNSTNNTAPAASSTSSDVSDAETTAVFSPQPGTYIILGGVFLRNYYTIFDAEKQIVSFAKVVHPPSGLISALQVIYIVLGAFIVLLFIAFVGCFARILFSKKAPMAEVASPERPLVETKITSSQFTQGFEGN